jgi:hypothetical protein
MLDYGGVGRWPGRNSNGSGGSASFIIFDAERGGRLKVAREQQL